MTPLPPSNPDLPEFDTKRMSLSEVLLRKLGIWDKHCEQLKADTKKNELAEQVATSSATLRDVTDKINRVIEALLTGQMDTKETNTILYALQTQLATVKEIERARQRKEELQRNQKTNSANANTPAAGTATPAASRNSSRGRARNTPSSTAATAPIPAATANVSRSPRKKRRS